ncbi:hypothetical protein GX865_02810 [Candidatus Saccharibacteria bacterium]|jgi:hypothetical protein|nr:hypothetical protein [Candidatus Saccharibacteria bacterium]
MEKNPQLSNSHERLEKVEFPNRETFQNYSPKDKPKNLRNFYQDYLKNPEYTDVENQMRRVIDFVSSTRELYEEGDQEIYSFGHDNKGTIYAVLSDESDPKKAVMIRMNPFDGEDSTEAYFSSSPVVYGSNRHSQMNKQISVARVQFHDELGNSTIFTFTNGETGNQVVEIGSNGDISDVSAINNVNMLDYEMLYDLGIQGSPQVRPDNDVRKSIENLKKRHLIQREVSRQAIRASYPDEELQPS